MARTPFVAKAAYDPSHPDALALYCSDGRFTDSVEELLHSLGHARLDTLTMAGGPGLFNLWIAGIGDSTSIASGAKFLIEAHRIKRVILIAHEGCGYYKKHLPGRAPRDVRHQQEDDLRLAARTLETARSGLRVDAFYACIAEGHVAFDPVAR
jgi:carbonic anhydrase